MNTEFWSVVFKVVAIGIFGLCVLGAVVAWVYDRYYSTEGRARRGLRGARRTPISQVTDGQVVKLVGELSCVGEPLRAPFSRRPCAYYHSIVEQEKSREGTRYFDWVAIVDESDCCAQILIDDGTGVALVELQDPEVVLKIDQRFGAKFLESAPEGAKAFLAKHHVTEEDSWRNLRFAEGALEQGEQVAVLGLCRLEPEPDAQAGGDGRGYRELQARMRPRIVAAAGKLLISDERGTR
jgi:hypothetical protein